MTDMRDRIATIVAGLRAVDYGEIFPSDYEAADAIIAALPELQGWQPIETAPKDATIIEAKDKDGAISRVRFLASFGGGRWCYVGPRNEHVGKAYGLRSWRTRRHSAGGPQR